jgi:hypothetical protein
VRELLVQQMLNADADLPSELERLAQEVTSQQHSSGGVAGDLTPLEQTVIELRQAGGLVDSLEVLRGMNKHEKLLPHLGSEELKISPEWAARHNEQIVEQLQLERTLHEQLDAVTAVEQRTEASARQQLQQVWDKVAKDEEELSKRMAHLTNSHRAAAFETAVALRAKLAEQPEEAAKHEAARSAAPQPVLGGSPTIAWTLSPDAQGGISSEPRMLIGVDTTHNGRADTLLLDSNGDGVVDSVVVPLRSVSGPSFAMALPPPPPLSQKPPPPESESLATVQPAHLLPANLEMQPSSGTEPASAPHQSSSGSRQGGGGGGGGSSSSSSRSPLPRYLQVETSGGTQRFLLQEDGIEVTIRGAQADGGAASAGRGVGEPMPTEAAAAAAAAAWPGAEISMQQAQQQQQQAQQQQQQQQAGLEPGAGAGAGAEEGGGGGNLTEKAMALLEYSDAVDQQAAAAASSHPADTGGSGSGSGGVDWAGKEEETTVKKRPPPYVPAFDSSPAAAAVRERRPLSSPSRAPSLRSATPPKRRVHGGGGGSIISSSSTAAAISSSSSSSSSSPITTWVRTESPLAAMLYPPASSSRDAAAAAAFVSPPGGRDSSSSLSAAVPAITTITRGSIDGQIPAHREVMMLGSPNSRCGRRKKLGQRFFVWNWLVNSFLEHEQRSFAMTGSGHTSRDHVIA